MNGFLWFLYLLFQEKNVEFKESSEKISEKEKAEDETVEEVSEEQQEIIRLKEEVIYFIHIY